MPCSACLISIHAPHAGCDSSTCFASSFAASISIHAPHAGCDLRRRCLPRSRNISIHAPHAGCDLKPSLFCVLLDKHFNPRTPCGVRREPELASRKQFCISIHAPHAGCDAAIKRALGFAVTFQSTHPMRGATQSVSPNPGQGRHFNPRTPCGVRRHGNIKTTSPSTYFNPRTPCGVRLAAPPPASRFCANFNPRTPCGVRPILGAFWTMIRLIFQSTHPMRGATRSFTEANTADIFQSTHPMRGATTAIPLSTSNV